MQRTFPLLASWALASATATAQISEIIDSTGDGAGQVLTMARSTAVDSAGNVYVTGFTSDNVFRIAPDGAITEVVDEFGDGSGHGLDGPGGIAVGVSGNVYVSGVVEWTLGAVHGLRQSVSERPSPNPTCTFRYASGSP